MKQKKFLLNRVRDEVQHEMAVMIKDIEGQAKEEAEKKHAKLSHMPSKNLLLIMFPKQPSR